jgi:hypothetical protein
MSVKDPYLTNVDLDVHLRDARHAHQLYTQHNFAFAPKTKFLFHVVFQPRPEVGNSATRNAFAFQKEIGVLAKSADLPSFRASVDNKQQYNRKKNIQTRVDYSDVNITFHDDNTGVTRALLEEYYRYYFDDGNKTLSNSEGAYNPRDKYFKRVPNYGLNNGKTGPFFSYITIYQLARRQWFAYTLVNPLITQWNHGNVDSSDGSALNENSISVAYEGVLYTNGQIDENGQPVGFADPSTRYDQVPSPLGYFDAEMSNNTYKQNDPALLDPSRNIDQFAIPRMSNSASTGPLGSGLLDLFGKIAPGGLAQTTVPKIDSQNSISISGILSRSIKKLTGADISTQLNSNPSAKKSFEAKALNSGAVAGLSYSQFSNLSSTAKSAVSDNLVNQAAGGDAKLANFASEAISATKV